MCDSANVQRGSKIWHKLKYRGSLIVDTRTGATFYPSKVELSRLFEVDPFLEDPQTAIGYPATKP